MNRSRPLGKERFRLLALALALSAGLSGCQSMSGLFSFGEDDQPQPGTLGALEPAAMPEMSQTAATADITREDVTESYRALLPLLQDPGKRVEVRHRLADLEFERAETELVENAVDEMAGAIEAYEDLLAESPNRSTNDRLLYQLARAYELRGMRDEQLAALTRLVNEFPQSEFWVESQFRRGDILFRENLLSKSLLMTP